MSTPRVRRLQSDYKKLVELANRSPFVEIRETEGTPPERYLLALRCGGISKLNSENKPVFANLFLLTIQLHHGYPSKAPIFEVVAEQTPIYHPNIGAGGLVCIGDTADHGWSPALSLDDVVIRIIQMIRYENVGFESPLNMFANEWAQKNTHLFPLDTTQIITDDELVITVWDEDLASTDKSDDDLLADIIIH